jgi:hypothetical protein
MRATATIDFLAAVVLATLLAAAPRAADPPAGTAEPTTRDPVADSSVPESQPAEPNAAPPANPADPPDQDRPDQDRPATVSAPPVTGTQPPARGDAQVSDAAALLAELLEPLSGRPNAPPLAAADAQLYARPLPLLEALERSGDRTRRLWIAQAYWKVSAAHAQVRCATEAIERLDLIAPGADPHDRATLDVVAAAARADVADARAQLGAAQQELVDLARLPLGEPLPWPVDRPLAGPYQTHFEAIFASRIATGRVRAIARTLPARHEALESRAAAVRAAAKATAMAEADHAKGKRPIEAVIAAHAALVGQQREFLQATRAYNLDIAEYAMAVADATVPDDRFVSMLIGTPIQWRPQPAPGTPPQAAAPAGAE